MVEIAVEASLEQQSIEAQIVDLDRRLQAGVQTNGNEVVAIGEPDQIYLRGGTVVTRTDNEIQIEMGSLAYRLPLGRQEPTQYVPSLLGAKVISQTAHSPVPAEKVRGILFRTFADSSAATVELVASGDTLETFTAGETVIPTIPAPFPGVDSGLVLFDAANNRLVFVNAHQGTSEAGEPETRDEVLTPGATSLGNYDRLPVTDPTDKDAVFQAIYAMRIVTSLCQETGWPKSDATDEPQDEVKKVSPT